MAKNGAQYQGISEEMQNRLDWMDEERRKTARRLAELEQRLTSRERNVKERDQRIKELEDKLTKTTAQLARISHLDTQLQQFKDEIVKMIEQYDSRRVQSQEEMDKLRRVEHEMQTREIASIHKEISAISRLADAMELREAEEARLATLIGRLQNKTANLENRVETWSRDLNFLEEAEREHARTQNELQTKIMESNKRWEPLQSRLDITGHGLSRAEINIQELTGIVAELRQSIQSWADQVQVGEYERNQRLQNWQRILDEQQETIKSFNREWIKFSDQYKEAKMAVQTISEWQRQIEQQQREANELTRVETNRMRSLWDNFLLENEKRWKTAEVDREQRWASSQRREKQLLEQIQEINDLLAKMSDDKETLWRIQSAQTDAMKKLPRIWLEEIEKAIAQNPNSRRQPALVPIRDDEL